jgi:hypothetical protein
MANWLKEQLELARREINNWPEWKKQELKEETKEMEKQSTERPKPLPKAPAATEDPS